MSTTETADAPVKLETLEIAKPDHIGALTNATARMNGYMDVLAPTDTIIQSKGGGIGQLSIYKELLRDDQVRSTLQQRRTAVVAKEWVVEPGAEDARADRDTKIFGLGFQPDEAYIKATYGGGWTKR